MKLTTEGEDGLDPHPAQNWTEINSKNLKSENKQQSKGNASFLNKFIEIRIDNDTTASMTSDSQKHTAVSQNSDNAEITPDNLSPQLIIDTSDEHKELESDKLLQSRDDSVGKQQQHKFPQTRRVEEIRRRIEENVDRSKANKEVKNVNTKTKDQTARTKVAEGDGKEECHKIETKRSKESPPRKVSFKIRNNGRMSSSLSSANSRRATITSKNMDSSKVAALASKFNAIIHENKDDKLQKLLTNSAKKLRDKSPVSRKSSGNSKRENSLNSVTVRKHNTAKVQSEQDGSSNVTNSKDKKRCNGSYRSSHGAAKSVSVKAAIQIFENNANTSSVDKSGAQNFKTNTVVRVSDAKSSVNIAKSSDNHSAVTSSEDISRGLDLENTTVLTKKLNKNIEVKNNVTNSSSSTILKTNATSGLTNNNENITPLSGDTSQTVVLTQSNAPSSEDKRESTVVSPTCEAINLDIISHHNGISKPENSTVDIVNGVNIVQTSDIPNLKTNYNSESKVQFNKNAKCETKKEPKYPRVVFKRDSTLVRVTLECEDVCNEEVMKPCEEVVNKSVPNTQDNSETSEIGKQTKTKPVVPIKNVKEKTYTSIHNKKDDPNYVKVMCKSYDQLDHTRAVTIKHVESMTPNRSFLWKVPPSAAQTQEDEQDYIYDDVYPPSSEYDDSASASHRYAVIEQEEDTYDLVGPPANTIPSDRDDVDDTYEYCSSEQIYDDCVGEGYAKDNIYDDVKSLRTPDTTSVSNCYESIYTGSDRLMPPLASTGRTGASSSASSSNSYCDQSNSLYGVGGSRFDSASVSQASTASAEDGPHEVMSYQLTSMVPRSETSDEWVDVEMTDSEVETKEDATSTFHGRSRSRRSPRRSRKSRKWNKPVRKPAGNLKNGDHSSDSDTDHHYEILDEIGNNKDEVHSDEFDSDSFDSDISDENYVKPLHQASYDIANGRLPEPPRDQNIYGISKIAEAAGKKMLKLGKSLRKIRNKRNSSTDIKACPPLPSPPSPSLQPPSLPSRPFPPPRMSEKSVSSGNLSGRKYWSLRKFKRSVSALDQTTSMSPVGAPKKETATFYLTQALDVDAESSETKTSNRSLDASDINSENGNLTSTSPSSLSSSTTIVDMRKQRPMSAPERRHSGNVRPNSPPPLPPHPTLTEPKKPPRKEKRSSSNTSWYAECGLFDQSSEVHNSPTAGDTPKRNILKQDRPTSNSWYAEVGLWDMSTSSTNDSSLSEQDARSQQTDLSGGDSPLTTGSPENSGVVERRFADEPLYQFYTASVMERDMRCELDSDGYEEIGDSSRKQPTRPTAMELIRPRDGQHRTLWCEIPEVINSRVLSTISTHQKKLQEAKFEIITSEASYINSLNVLEKHFISSPELNDESVLSRNDRRILFSNVIPVKTSSELFLAELEECWQDNILLHGICEVIYKHASNHFGVYIKYCSNQIYLDRTLRALKEQHGRFSEVLSQLESSPVCQALSLHSFLMLPMQRITRLPLLIDAVLTRLDPKDDEYDACRMALATVNKVVQDCNEGARRMERMEEILILSRQLDFPREVKAVPIISSSRWLVKAGELIQLVWRGDEGKLTFGKKFSKVTLHMFLFTDLLFVTKKKSEECYVVLDYCPRNLVQMTSAEGMSHLPVKFTADGGRNLMLLTMLQNHEKKTVEMILSCSLESDRQRWLEAVSQPISDNPNETVYEEWDCPQVTAIHPYVAQQPDELSLDVADVVNVLRKITDGWYQGERIRDGERGWFPGNYTIEIASSHVRARNLKQRYRLLALSGNFLESQRKEKQSK